MALYSTGTVLVTCLFFIYITVEVYKVYPHSRPDKDVHVTLRLAQIRNEIQALVAISEIQHNNIVTGDTGEKADAAKFKQQRNGLSKIMNSLAHDRAILECEMQKVANRDRPASETGCWCDENPIHNVYNHVTDETLITALSDFFTGKRVGSFGDGRGHYKAALDFTGKLAGYDAYDGGPYYGHLSEGRVKFMDLTLPQYGIPLYDWVMSLEVAEHIPGEFESIYVSNLVRHAKEGLILSWAVPNQVGLYHINNRPLDYVINILDKLGFSHDLTASFELQEAAAVTWLKQNINVYRRRGSSTVNLDDL